MVDDLSRLQDCPDEASVHQVLAIVARGLPVITSASWSLARGDPECVPAESVIRHRPLAMEKKCVFEYDKHLKARSSNLVKTLMAISEIEDTKWEVRLSDGGVANANDKGYEFVNLHGVDVVRSWIQKHRRIDNVLGSKAWTLTHSIL